MIPHSYKKGEFVFKEGDPSGFVCRLVSGEVEVLKEFDRHTVVLGTVREGELIGEMGVIEDKARSATVRTKTEVSAELMTKEEFLRLMCEDTSSAYQLLSRLCDRLRSINQKFAEVTVSKDPPSQGLGDLSGRDDESSVQSDIGQITIIPKAEIVDPGFPPEGLLVNDFPFNVGRRSDSLEQEPYLKIHLPLKDNPPFRLSRIHFALENTSKGFLVRDLGSTLGTQVNKEFLGNDFALDFSYLKPGENSIIAGGLGSPFMFTVLLQ